MGTLDVTLYHVVTSACQRKASMISVAPLSQFCHVELIQLWLIYLNAQCDARHGDGNVSDFLLGYFHPFSGKHLQMKEENDFNSQT